MPGALDIIGVAQATATTTVNTQATSRKVEYYRAELACSNATNLVCQSVTNKAVLGQDSSNVIGTVFLPKTPQVFSYDLDGNLTNDGRWNYTWDSAREIETRNEQAGSDAGPGTSAAPPPAPPFISRAKENRLIKVSTVAGTPSPWQRTNVFVYDYQGRRSRKKVYGSGGSVLCDVTFVYDGWNLIAELDNTKGNVRRSYVWGQDLSGTMDGAGGVGGLLVVVDASASAHHYAMFDGNGNVTGLVKGEDASVSARYEYGPFGEPIRVSGPMAAANPFRWSTKFTDQETDLVYYGRRFFNPVLGRWLSRDPIGEKAGPHLYAFLNNRAICVVDTDGSGPWILTYEHIERLENLVGVLQETLEACKAPMAAAGGSVVTNLIVGAGQSFLTAGFTILDAGQNILKGSTLSEPGSPQRNAEDLLLNSLWRDTAAADLDAVTLAIQSAQPWEEGDAAPKKVIDYVLNRSYATSDAVTAWFGISLIEDTLAR